MKLLALLCLPILLAACATTATPVASPPPGPARIGDTVYIDGPTVRPLEIIEDSRCPADVTCVWAGRVVIRAEIGTGAGKQEVTLTLGVPAPVADGVLMLRDVTPSPHSRKPIKPGDYRFSFDFSGGI